MDHLTIDWRDSFTTDPNVTGVWLVNGLTVEQFNIVRQLHPELEGDKFMTWIKLAGYEVEYIPLSNG